MDEQKKLVADSSIQPVDGSTPNSDGAARKAPDHYRLQERDEFGRLLPVQKKHRTAAQRRRRTTEAIVKQFNSVRSVRLANHIAAIIEDKDASNRDRIAAWNALQPYMLDQKQVEDARRGGDTFVFVLPEQAREFSAKHVDNEA